MDGTTIWISKETKEMLDKMKTKTYDEAIKKLIQNPGMPYLISLTKTVPPKTWFTREDNYVYSPFTGRLVNCNIFTPAGCQDLVYIKIGVRNTELSDWIISGDNKMLNIPLNRDVQKNDVIWAEIMNKDLVYEHTPTIEFVLIPLETRVL